MSKVKFSEDQLSCLRPLGDSILAELEQFAEEGNRLNSVQGESAEELALALKFRQGWYSGVLAAAQHLKDITEEQENA